MHQHDPPPPSTEPTQEAQEEGSEVTPPAQETPAETSAVVVATDDHRVRILFERCLIACTLYEEFWTRVRGGVYMLTNTDINTQSRIPFLEGMP